MSVVCACRAFQGAGGNPEQGEFPEFQAPHLTLASPAGIQTMTEGSTHVASAEHTAVTSGGHTSISSGKSLLAAAKDAIRLFADKTGMKLVAATANIGINLRSGRSGQLAAIVPGATVSLFADIVGSAHKSGFCETNDCGSIAFGSLTPDVGPTNNRTPATGYCSRQGHEPTSRTEKDARRWTFCANGYRSGLMMRPCSKRNVYSFRRKRLHRDEVRDKAGRPVATLVIRAVP